MTPGPPGARAPSAEESTERLRRRLERERVARREAEQIAERTTRALYDKQQELVLLEAVATASNESSTLEDAIQFALDKVCAHTGWPIGHAYLRDRSSGELVPTTLWHMEESSGFEEFRRATERSTFRAGVGLPGRVLAMGRPAWITDVTNDANFPRRGLGVRGAFAFPILVGAEVEGVLEYFTAAVAELDPALLGVMSQIGTQLGRVVERFRAQEQIAHQAMHDPLTGLPNRILFLDRLELALARSKRRSSVVAVLFLDLDRFKFVNDSLGHSVGDQLLKSVAERLKAALRTTDTLARFGGDEFVVLCEDLADERDTVRLAERIQRSLLNPFCLEDDEHTTSVSVGIALATAADRDADALLRAADIAMYRAKERGPGQYELFDEALRNRALARLATERDLRGALDTDELRLHYQPIVALDGGAVQSVEALVRWQHPERGLLPPAEFLPVAEESALILRLGAWTLREACLQASRWRALFGEGAPLPVSVNLGARQLAQVELPEIISQVLAETRVPARDLAIELTETALIENAEVPAATLRELRALGVKVLLDDFGTGYSSLSYLHSFPIDVLKIDRSFVMRLGARGGDPAIVRAIAAMASALGLELVAEGVESADQAAAAWELGCALAQGYYFARPAPPKEIESLIRRSRDSGGGLWAA